MSLSFPHTVTTPAGYEAIVTMDKPHVYNFKVIKPAKEPSFTLDRTAEGANKPTNPRGEIPSVQNDLIRAFESDERNS